MLGVYSRYSHRIHDLLFTLFLGAMLSYGAFYAYYMLSHFDLLNYVNSDSDDSFYYFQIAKNLAEGQFSTFDGGITRTNGYHPAWALLLTPFYWVFDLESALPAIKTFQIALIAIAAALIVLSARLLRLPWIALFALLPGLYAIQGLYNGMEAAAALFSLALLFLALSLYARNAPRWFPMLAAVAFVLPWFRLEYLAISLTATFGVTLIEWLRQPRPFKLSMKTITEYPSYTYVPALSACLGGLIYFIYNKLAFGGFIPVSAAVKRSWWSRACFEGDVSALPPLLETLYGQTCLEGDGGFSFIKNLMHFFRSDYFYDYLPVALEMCVYAFVTWWLFHRSRSKSDWLFLIFLVGAASLAVGHMAKFAQSAVTIHPIWGRPSWYYVPGYLMMAMVVPIRCYVAVFLIKKFIEPKWKAESKVLMLAVVVMSALALIPYAYDKSNDGFHRVDKISSGDGIGQWNMTRYLGTIQVMNLALPEDAIVGSWDAGRIGYFSSVPVVNLDGLVNSYDYLDASMNGNVDSLLDKYGITHFANIMPVNEVFDNTLYEGIPIRNNNYEFKLWAAKPTGMASGEWVWSRLVPHFDHLSDDVGVMVSGRLAQVIVRNCVPERVQEMKFIFSWGDDDSKGARYSWQEPRKNNVGHCVNGFELPREVVHPARIDVVLSES